ncbi:guanine nucleotide-binding protein G(T) subunit gamma-T1 [Ursus maritimus]|uniref:Guanine nucleotide-binding protein subunit gamma n=1 Tax=Ursus maritimus TaxID=29073 RepID=A0A384BQQ3_URSMA|nr:guanine nucleotide-binding protein G(T) subunit gamma-T1 [Ursus maritimus]
MCRREEGARSPASRKLGCRCDGCLLYVGQKMPVINIEDLTEKDKLKMEVDQLKKEVTLERMLVSKCCEEVRDYVEERSGEDPLVKGIPEDKNPFKELKGGCVVS